MQYIHVWSSSSSYRAFPIIWGRQNGFEYNSSTLLCPVRPSSLNPHFPYVFYKYLFIHLGFCLPLRLFHVTGASNMILLVIEIKFYSISTSSSPLRLTSPIMWYTLWAMSIKKIKKNPKILWKWVGGSSVQLEI